MSDSLQPPGLSHNRPLCPPPFPCICLHSCPLSQWCHLTISSSTAPFACGLQSFPKSGSSQWYSSHQVAKVLFSLVILLLLYYCHYIIIVVVVQLLSLLLLFCNPMDCSRLLCPWNSLEFSRILEWVAMPFSRGSPGIEPGSSALPADSLPSEPLL